ncbi:MAG: hypothetical protein ACRDP7_30190 [Trebonia sp.]
MADERCGGAIGQAGVIGIALVNADGGAAVVLPPRHRPDRR